MIHDGKLIKGSDMESCKLIGEYLDVRDGDYIEARYYFGRPFSKSDYTLEKRVYKPLITTPKNDNNIPF